jgi:hypothetical protein
MSEGRFGQRESPEKKELSCRLRAPEGRFKPRIFARCPTPPNFAQQQEQEPESLKESRSQGECILSRTVILFGPKCAKLGRIPRT